MKGPNQLLPNSPNQAETLGRNSVQQFGQSQSQQMINCFRSKELQASATKGNAQLNVHFYRFLLRAIRVRSVIKGGSSAQMEALKTQIEQLRMEASIPRKRISEVSKDLANQTAHDLSLELPRVFPHTLARHLPQAHLSSFRQFNL
uniref:G protein gamma domain-containing protein n=1 Tax=Romanomermis culicivorax TaxID=13658 RepID=A0A915IUA2_ROMCU